MQTQLILLYSFIIVMILLLITVYVLKFNIINPFIIIILNYLILFSMYKYLHIPDIKGSDDAPKAKATNVTGEKGSGLGSTLGEIGSGLGNILNGAVDVAGQVTYGIGSALGDFISG
jgi:hypothetical protein